MHKTLLGAALAAALFTVRPSDDDATPKIDELAPAFRLNDHEGRATAIGGENEEWTVLAFFPKAMTPG